SDVTVATPIHAAVTLVNVATSAPAPTPALLPPPMAPATLKIVVFSKARTFTDETAAGSVFVVVMNAPSLMYAFVVSFRTLTVADPATPNPPALAPIPAAIERLCSRDVAVTERPRIADNTTVPSPPLS